MERVAKVAKSEERVREGEHSRVKARNQVSLPVTKGEVKYRQSLLRNGRHASVLRRTYLIVSKVDGQMNHHKELLMLLKGTHALC